MFNIGVELIYIHPLLRMPVATAFRLLNKRIRDAQKQKK